MSDPAVDFSATSLDVSAPAPGRGFAVRFDAARTRLVTAAPLALDLALRRLEGPREERLAWPSGALRAGVEVEPIPDSVEAATRRLYPRLLKRARGGHLCRIWNYVPHINAPGPDGLENYRGFSRARAQAFEAAWGADFSDRLPAASAVGGATDALAVVYLVADASPCPVENPRQVPAYAYPAEHGPRPPSFSRATVLDTPDGGWTFISGTASIRGHETIAPHDLEGQLTCTCDNLRLVGEGCGVGGDLGAAAGWSRLFKVYLRHPADLAPTQRRLAQTLLRPSDTVIWLDAAICRAELVVEIEATLYRAR